MNDPKDAENLQNIHLKLQEVMRLELKLLREILTLMKEEEEALCRKNKELHSALFAKRSDLKKKVKEIQKIRRKTTKELLKEKEPTINLHHFNSKIFEDIVSQDEENASETFSLREQILAIISHIDKQKLRLSKSLKTNMDFLEPSLQPSTEKSPHSTLSTIDPEEESEENSA